jgi:hypothetical protein
MVGLKKLYAEIAWLYGKNNSTIRKAVNIKNVRASFYVAPQTAYFTVKARDKYLMKFEKVLNICL